MPNRTLPYEIVDVFTDRAFAGNPLAIVLDAERLSGGQMQALAREFHLSETTFPGPSEHGDYRVRIFTPEAELPFAGHPSIGTAHTLVRLGRLAVGERTQDCAAGLLPVRVDETGATLTGGPPVVGEPLDPAPLLAAVGLGADDRPAAGTAPPRAAGCGISFAFLPVRPDAVARAQPNPDAIRAAGVPSGISVVCWDAATRTAHVRVFVPELGVAEDPATGSAGLGLGVWLVAGGLVDADGTTAYVIRQGQEIHRPSTLDCTVSAVGGRASRATVRGQVVPVASGRIRIPDQAR